MFSIFKKKETNKRYILALDEGTTSTRAVLFDIEKNQIVAQKSEKFKQFYPKLGWVEQDANDMYQKSVECLKFCLKNIDEDEVLGLGITNQRETVVAFNKKTGEPIQNAIVWQCRRTAEFIEKIPTGVKQKIREKTGLIADAYFSASKMKWILDNNKEAQELAQKGELGLGTVDAYLAFKLTGKFVTDTTNASRTMLFNINTSKWDEELLEYFGLNKKMLPKVVDTAHKIGKVNGYKFSLNALVGDQQSSLIGQGCFKEGETKITYGTGCFILTNIGENPKVVDKVLTTVGYTINGKTKYALEGSIFSACNTLNWMHDNLNLFDDYKKLDEICYSVKDTNGVYLVPAFTGLGSPYWNSTARANISGLTLDSKKEHIVRAGVESMAYNAGAILNAMREGGVEVTKISADGGGSKNDFLLDFQSSIASCTVLRNQESEATAMGAVYLVGLCNKIYTIDGLDAVIGHSKTFNPSLTEEDRQKLILGWEKAVKLTCSK